MSEAAYYTQVKWIYNQYSGRCGQQGEGRKGWRIGFLASGSPNGLDASR